MYLDEAFELDLSFADLLPKHLVSSAAQTANFSPKPWSNEFS